MRWEAGGVFTNGLYCRHSQNLHSRRAGARAAAWPPRFKPMPRPRPRPTLWEARGSVKGLRDLVIVGLPQRQPMPLRWPRHQRTLSNSLRARPVSLPERFISCSSPCTDTHQLAANASPLRIRSRLTRDGLAWPALWTWGDGPGFFVLALLCYCLILPFCILEVVAETYLAASICIPKQ